MNGLHLETNRRRDLFGIVTSLLLALTSWSCQSRPPTPDEGLAAWIHENAITIQNLDSSADDPQLKFLDKAVEGKRVVFLGEDAHWVHEKWDYRLIVLKHLLASGFTNIGMEMGISDGRKIDAFLRSGNIEDLNHVALYGYRDGMIRTRTPSSSCSLSTKANPQMPALFKNEETWFFFQN